NRLCTVHAGDTQGPHSFPTRRSSDLNWRRAARPWRAGGRAPERGSAPHGAQEGGVVIFDTNRWNRIRYSLIAPLYDAVVRFSGPDRKSTRLNSSHVKISYAVFCLKKK